VAVDHRGSALAAILWLGISALFSWYASSFGKFNETYGSLGAVIGFMTWLWISAIVILLGTELDARWNIRPRATPRPAPRSPWGHEGPGWLTRLERAQSG
jgi:membrane protein